MSSQITNQYPGSVGRMFARQSAPTVYDAQKKAAGVEADAANTASDSVSLSPMAPKPLTAGFLEQAMATGKSLQQGSSLGADAQNRLREDRIFAAVSALTLAGYSGANPVAGWPGGLPTPSQDELEAARRRIAQRPTDLQDAANADAVRDDRVDLFRRIGKTDLAALSFVSA